MTRQIAIAVKQLSAVAALLLVGYFCRGRLRFSSNLLNLTFFCGYYAVPFFAIRPLQHLHRAPKIAGLVVLTPLLLFSSVRLLVRLVFGNTEHAATLQTLEMGGNTIELQRYENGGALGIHGINLEQRRSVMPGLYLVKSVAFFDDAREAVLSMDRPYVFKVHASGNYYSNDNQIDREYSLKPWVYF